jgi:hypothetical protein
VTYRPAPRLEERSSAAILAKIRSRLAADPKLKWLPPDPSVEALIQVFARYWEIVSGRLNQALDKNFLAYLNYLGVSPISPTSAVVPLTFTAVEGAPTGVIVPTRAQVAAAAPDGGEPVVFETVRSLAIAGARVRHIVGLDPTTNTQTDLARVVDAVVQEPISAMSGAQPSEHVFFIGDDSVFSLEHISSLTVRLDLAAATPLPGMRSSLEWFTPGPKEVSLSPVLEGTAGLRHNGDVVFQSPAPWPEPIEIQRRRSRWLACRVVATNSGNWSAYARRLELRAEVRRPNATIDAAFADTADVDLSKDFYPFGIRPAFGSTFYVASQEAFSRAGAKVTLDFALTNAFNATEEPPIPRVFTEGHPRVWWEYWNGTRWARLAGEDGTKAFRLSGSVEFEIPGDFARTVVRGSEGAWVRARLASGHYGEDERWELADPGQPAAGMIHRDATLAPPSVQTVTASYTLTIAKVPDVIITSNERVYQDESARAHAGLPFALFNFPCGQRPALYLGVSQRAGEDTLDEPLTLYVVASSIGAPSSRSDEDATAAVVDWQFWDGTEWLDFEVSDETGALARSGAITLVAPSGVRTRRDFVDESPLYWFRVVPREGVTWRPALRAVLRNTVLAAHRSTIETEVLGSSHADPHQVYEVIHRPVLEGELLQVREPASAPPPALGEHMDEDGEPDTESRNHVWKIWRPVDDFLSSTPDDRHYVIDRSRGSIEFGDGQRGRIPPSGSNNVRLRRYESGGGSRGNVPAGAANQLRSSVPYIASAGNLIAAAGGADIEPMDRVRHRGATLPRHRQRAVTVEDYQDLALLASAQVARAECVPMFDLSLEPAVRRRQPGLVSVIVVPDGAVSRLTPDPELLRQVRHHLDGCRNTATDLVVVGPEYVETDVEVEVAVGDANMAGDVSRMLKVSIEAFLHPLSGGLRGEGWRLGELPQRGDLYALCASTPGVTWVDALRVTYREDRVGLLRAQQFLTCSGRHRVAVEYTRELASRTSARRSG